MKIAVWHNLPSGGGKRALYYHVKGLVEHGHTVESWCPPTADQTYLPFNEVVTEHIVPFSWQPRTAKNRLDELVIPYRNVVDQIAAMDRHCQQCAEEINRGEFDLLFANACMFFRATSIARYVNIPKVLYLQEPYRWLYEAMPKHYEAAPRLPWLAIPSAGKSQWRPQYLLHFLKDMIRVQGLRVQAREEVLNAEAFDAILVNSLFSRESILRAYGLDAKVCYLGIDTELFTDQHLQREDFIIGLGAFVPEKNIRFVIEALSIVKEPRPRLVWVGNVAIDPFLEEMRQLAHSLHVDFEPKLKIEDRKLVNLFNRAAMMVYAPRLEPFGFAPLEANACGLPVIAVAEGGVRETVIDGINGLLVEHDVKEVAKAIEHLRNDKDYARQLGESGHKLATEKWSLNAAIDRLERRFAEAMDAVHQQHGREMG